MTGFDDILEGKNEAEWRRWKEQVNDELDAIAQFVADRRGGRYTNRTGYFAGSFNICIQFGFEDDGPDAIIRFPKPGPVIFRDEKVMAEVSAMKFIQQHTTIPVPHIISWGLTADSPGTLGPFIIMDFIQGVDLTDIMRKPGEAKYVLDPEIKTDTLKVIYDQISDFYLQLDLLSFDKIGSLREADSTCVVGGRPWTYNMNEVATSCGVPVDVFGTKTMDSCHEYMSMLAKLHLDHLEAQRNIATDRDDASRRYIARHLFNKLVARRAMLHGQSENSQFKLFCDDLRPGNMLVDKETLRITAVLDFEFTNVLPCGFAESPPWWLLLVGPDMFLDRGFTMSRFAELYQPQLGLFLDAMKRQEQKQGLSRLREPLSNRMQKSWDSGDFWYFFAARKSMDIDILFFEQLDRLFFRGDAGIGLLEPTQREGMDQFTTMKMKQKREYDEEYAAIVAGDKSHKLNDRICSDVP